MTQGTETDEVACKHLCYNYEKYPLSPLKPRFLVLIEQYLPNISDPVYSVHQSCMCFLWFNWRKSTFYPVTAPNDSKCSPIVTSSIQERAASNCDVTMTDCSRVVAMDAFLAQFITAQWSTENTLCFNFFVYLFFNFVTPRVSTRGIASYTYYDSSCRTSSFSHYTLPPGKRNYTRISPIM